MSNRYTFLDIYKNDLDLNKDTKVKISQIVIPKIQRPYAQGRLDGVCTYVRNTLLNEMFANFKTDEVFDFNFIYGIVRPSNETYGIIGRAATYDNLIPGLLVYCKPRA